MGASTADIINHIDGIDFGTDHLNLAFKYYYLKYFEHAGTFDHDLPLKNKLTQKVESDLTQALTVDSWTLTLARLIGRYDQRFLIEQAMRRENIIFDSTSEFDQVFNKKLMNLAGKIACGTGKPQSEAKELFESLLKNSSAKEDQAQDLLAEHAVLHKKTYAAFRSKISVLIDPKNPNNKKAPGMDDPLIAELLTFLLDLQDSSRQEFDGFDLLAEIKNTCFSLDIDDTNVDSIKSLEVFSKLLIDLFFQFENSPTGPYQNFEKLALLEYYKRLVNKVSDQYDFPYRITKIKMQGKDKFTEKDIIIKNCLRHYEQLHAENIDDTSIPQPTMTHFKKMSLIELKKLDTKLAHTLDTYHQVAVIAEQISDILSTLEWLRPVHENQTPDYFIPAYSKKSNKVITDTKGDATARLTQIDLLHSSLFNDVAKKIEVLNRNQLISLAQKLLAVYPYVPKRRYSHSMKFAEQLESLRTNNQNPEKNLKDLRKLVQTMSNRIQQKHVDERLKHFVNTVPSGRKFEFGYETRNHSHAKKKARRIDKSIIYRYAWPIRLALAGFQAAVSYGGAVEFFAPMVAMWIAMTIGGVGFVLSWISNDQLVYQPLYRLLIDIFLDNKLSKAENPTARNIFKIAFLLCIGTGLTMAIVALSFSLSLFLEPVMAIFITLALLDVLPTTLGFGALMFKTFEDFVLSIVNFFKALTWEYCKYLVKDMYNKLSAASVEERMMLILTGVLTPLIIAAAIGFTAMTTIGMIGAWYVKVSAFFIEHLGFTPWASSAATFLLVGVCSAPIRSIFNIKNIMWMGFFGAELLGRYCIVRPILFPFNVAHHLYHHSDTLFASMKYRFNNFFNDYKNDPHLYRYRAKYRFSRTLNVSSWFAVIWGCVAFNGVMTGMAAGKGGQAVSNATGLDPLTGAKVSMIANGTLSLGSNGGNIYYKTKATAGPGSEMVLEDTDDENILYVKKKSPSKSQKDILHLPKKIAALDKFGMFKPKLIVVKNEFEKKTGHAKDLGTSIYNQAKHKVQHIVNGRGYERV